MSDLVTVETDGVIAVICKVAALVTSTAGMLLAIM